ncbi:MAG TPA: sigma-70 family RNA polymerase sigma factor [Azonexus sp.]
MNDTQQALLDGEFLAATRRDMIRFAHLQLRDAAQAEDAVQEALVAAFANARGFTGRAALKTWIFAILKHKIIDLLRRQARTPNVSALAAADEPLDRTVDALFQANGHWQADNRPGDWGDPEEALRQQRFWEVFEACLEHLPEATARVFMMREFLDFETAEICRELGISSGNCHVILHRARHGLRRCLEQGWFAPGERPC